MSEPILRHLRLAAKGGAFVPPTDVNAEAAVLSAVMVAGCRASGSRAFGVEAGVDMEPLHRATLASISAW